MENRSNSESRTRTDFRLPAAASHIEALDYPRAEDSSPANLGHFGGDRLEQTESAAIALIAAALAIVRRNPPELTAIEQGVVCSAEELTRSLGKNFSRLAKSASSKTKKG